MLYILLCTWRHLYTANAERCLQSAEKRKFMTMGNSTVTGNTITREDVLRTLFTDAILLQIWAICPFGGMSPMHFRFLFGDDPIRLLSFTTNRPQAASSYVSIWYLLALLTYTHQNTEHFSRADTDVMMQAAVACTAYFFSCLKGWDKAAN